MTERKNVFDRLAEADTLDKGMRLSAEDVADLMDELCELEMQLRISLHLTNAYILDREATGVPN